jgi:prepilin-type N-terminal cleavage/methylation domain-containing protein
MVKLTKLAGFTLVEVMIVIVVISVLVAISVVGYGGAQRQSRESRIDADIRHLSEIVQVARVRSGKTLQGITGSYWTGRYCMFQASDPTLKIPDGTDFSQQIPMTQACWNDYLSALQDISDASGTDVTDMRDPWGRPYYIDENDYIGGPCNKDVIGWLSYPYKGGYAQNWPEHIASYDEVCTPR